jgi:glycosyltransferase involved in cell wall biosynthesis
MDSVLISIIIASYNGRQFILKALEQIKKQSFKEYEIIIVDDASTDDSVEIIKKWASENPNIRLSLIKNEANMGINLTKGAGISHAAGEYICIHDQDDWMDEGFLEAIAKCAQETDADKIKTQIRVVDENGNTLYEIKTNSTTTKWTEMMTHATVYRRSILADYAIVDTFSEDIGDDMYINAWFNGYCRSFVAIPQTYYNWTKRPNSQSGIESASFEKFYLSMDNIYAAISPHYKRLPKEEVVFFQLAFLFIYFSHIMKFVYASSYKRSLQLYRIITDYYNECFPGIFKCRAMSAINKKNGYRLSVRLAMSVLILTKKMRLMPAFMTVCRAFRPIYKNHL